MTDDELLDSNQAADYLRVSRATLYREHQRGVVKMTKVRGSTFWRRSELDRYIRSQERSRNRVA